MRDLSGFPDPGRLRHRVIYQTPNPPSGAFGETGAGWTPQGTYWAEVRSPTGRELMNAGGEKAILTHVIEMQHPGFLPAQNGRFVEGSSVYNVLASTDPEGRGRKLVVQALHNPAEIP